MIPLALPSITDAEIAAVTGVVKSGWLTTGPEVDAFEKEFAEACGPACHAVAVSSATAGLMLAAIVRGLLGKTVAVPTWTYTATVEALVHAGAKPMVMDIDPVTLNMIRSPNNGWLDAAMPVHIAGNRDQDVWTERAIIEDAAHCLPYSPSDMAVFSFYATKPVACGEGGMVVTTSGHWAERLRQLRFHGFDHEVYDRHITGYRAHHVVSAGFKANMPDMMAAIGRVQLRRMVETHKARSDLWLRYRTLLRGCMLPPWSEQKHSQHLFIVQVPDKDRFLGAMREKGVACGVHYEPIHRHPYWAEKLNLKPSDYPNAEAARRHCVSLPLWAGMTEAQQDHVIRAVAEVLT